ncbi:ATP-binding domain-containing protein, partial [Rhodoblastus acidophilus]
NRDLGVKNGMLGEVTGVSEGRLMARLDSAEGPGRGREVSVAMSDYAAIDHGYATTIHKSQGATVDRAYVLASEGMDRHLTYVAMTRHREDAMLYAGRDEFKGVRDLRERLSRSGAKETTLDYAERRGIAAELGIASRIEVPRRVQELGRAALSDDDRARAEKEARREKGRRDRPAPEQNGGRPPGPAPARPDAIAARQTEQDSLARRAPREARETESSREDPLLALARSVLARKEERERPGAGAEPAAPADARTREAVAAARQAYQTARGVAEARAAYEAARAREIEAARVAQEARQKAEAEAQRKAEQERQAEQERGQRQRRSYGMEM